MLDEFEANESLNELPDPNIEQVFVGLVDELVSTSFEMTEMIGCGWRSGGFTARSIDQVGGWGTMDRVLALLKELRGVVGIKRKLSDADWQSSETEVTESLTSSVDDNTDDRRASGSSMPDLASSTPSSGSDTAGDSVRDSNVTEASEISRVRRDLDSMVVGGQDNSVDLQPGMVVEVDGLQRVAVAMVADGQYSDDVFIIPGPSIMGVEEREIHERDENDYEVWMDEMRAVDMIENENDDMGGENGSDDSNEDIDSGIDNWSSRDKEE